MRVSLALLLSLVATFVVGQQPPPTEVVLVPTFGAAQAGELGSLWVSSFSARNTGSVPVYFAPLPLTCQGTCPVVTTYLPPMTTARPSNPGRTYPGGALFYVDKALAANVQYGLHIQDTSRQATDAGVEIPVVRERDARTSTIILNDVPLDNRFRQRLRVYDIDAQGTNTVRVTFYDATDNTGPLATASLQLPAPQPRQTTASPEEPGFAQLANWIDRFPQLQGHAVVRVEIDPVSTGLRFWAFVTVTNNDSQHVTVISPQ